MSTVTFLMHDMFCVLDQLPGTSLLSTNCSRYVCLILPPQWHVKSVCMSASIRLFVTHFLFLPRSLSVRYLLRFLFCFCCCFFAREICSVYGCCTAQQISDLEKFVITATMTKFMDNEKVQILCIQYLISILDSGEF